MHGAFAAARMQAQEDRQHRDDHQAMQRREMAGTELHRARKSTVCCCVFIAAKTANEVRWLLRGQPEHDGN